jgi:hypothetical protein
MIDELSASKNVPSKRSYNQFNADAFSEDSQASIYKPSNTTRSTRKRKCRKVVTTTDDEAKRMFSDLDKEMPSREDDQVESYSEKTDDFLNKLVDTVERPNTYKRKRECKAEKVDYVDTYDSQKMEYSQEERKKSNKKSKCVKIT